MNTQKLDSEIISKVKGLNTNQKSDVLSYLDTIPRQKHNTKIYRRKALRQIREALESI